MEMSGKTQEENEIRVAEEYLSSLSDLNCNSKPLINMLTMLAEENIEYAPVIVKVVEQHIAKIGPDFKLPILYLIDSIVKNVKSSYISLFSQCIVNIFCGVFEQVNEKIRERMYSLRQTWNEVFSSQKMYALDVRVKQMDANWPITAKQPQPSIHVNPNFLKSVNTGHAPSNDMEEILHAKTRELLELKKRKLELELEATKKHLEEQEKQLYKSTVNVTMEQIGSSSTVVDATTNHPSSSSSTLDLVPQHQFSKESLNSHSLRIKAQPHAITTSLSQGLHTMGNVKSKVHPVNSTLLNTIRHRDPRLIRKQELQFENCKNGQVSNRSNAKSEANPAYLDAPSLYFNQSGKNKPNRVSERMRSGSKSPIGSSIIIQTKTSNPSVNLRSVKEKSIDETNIKANNGKPETTIECDKDVSEITGSKHKSNFSDSPAKSKDYKRSNKSRNHSRGKNCSSRSSRPTSLKDLQRQRPKSSSVSFVKHVNKEKEDYRSSNDSNDLVKTSSSTKNDTNPEILINAIENEDTDHSKPVRNFSDKVKKRLASTTEETPPVKKCKGRKIDKLFGSEDVDLRQKLSPNLLKPIADNFPPSPTKMYTGKVDKTWENEETKVVYSSENAVTMKDHLENVRGKLAKSANSNHEDKIDTPGSDISNRFKLDELHINEDSQEANDEKIRTMITQAQELLEHNSISHEQYRNLVQTVMSINENNKLKEAKRRELLDQDVIEKKSQEDSLMAAKDAVLKKRIPKLNKDLKAQSENKMHLKVKHSAMVTGKDDTNDNRNNNKLTKYSKEKRSKPSKWGDKVEHVNQFLNGIEPLPLQRPWDISGVNNRPNYRNNILNIQGCDTATTLNNRIANIPWQINSPLIIPPSVTPKPCNSIDNPQSALVRTITIDGFSKEIRIYDDKAIVFMELDQPREIGFQPGQRSITIDNQEPIILTFNDEYKPIIIDGKSHLIRFGFPSRELYIDENWYEVYFGGPPISIPINNKLHNLKAEGPPPKVHIGPIRRDLVVGKINMIIDAQIVIPLFLDAKVQKFSVGNVEHTIQFADNLKTVLFNNEIIDVEFGGLPKSLLISGKKCFVRFSALPSGVVPGEVQIKGMIRVKSELQPPVQCDSTEVACGQSQLNDVLKCSSENNNGSSPWAETELGGDKYNNKTQNPLNAAATKAALSNLNIDELFQKLVSTGILDPNITKNNIPVEKSEVKLGSNSTHKISESIPQETIIPVELSKPESIKTRQRAIILGLYSGMQCSSCGVRFPPEQTMKYSQHLDWHFRQNRRERDSTRKAHSRKWYYDTNDWIQYEEIEETEDREKNFFDTQQNTLESHDDLSNQQLSSSPIQSCPADPSDVDRTCDLCHEKFEQFYNEELEEWHLRSAIRIDDKTYHPICYNDFKKTTDKQEPTEEPEKTLLSESDNAIDITLKPTEDTKSAKLFTDAMADYDDDVIVLPNEEPLVTEIDDDDEYVPSNVELSDLSENKNKMNRNGNDNDESDVEIQEPNIPFTDLDAYEETPTLKNQQDSNFLFMNLKIKEEPKDDDDGFEDIGTVILAPEDHATHNSDLPSQAVGHSAQLNPENRFNKLPTDSNAQPSTANVTETSSGVSLTDNGNLEAENGPNLPLDGLAPAIHLSSLNKIKINITKNVASNTQNILTSVNAMSDTQTLQSTVSQGVPAYNSTVNPESKMSILCGGDASRTECYAQNMNTIGTSNINDVNNYPAESSSKPPGAAQPTQLAMESMPITYKPALQAVQLKTTNKIESGSETSGLCLIM